MQRSKHDGYKQQPNELALPGKRQNPCADHYFPDFLASFYRYDLP